MKERKSLNPNQVVMRQKLMRQKGYLRKKLKETMRKALKELARIRSRWLK
jgi:hypothetical protein